MSLKNVPFFQRPTAPLRPRWDSHFAKYRPYENCWRGRSLFPISETPFEVELASERGRGFKVTTLSHLVRRFGMGPGNSQERSVPLAPMQVGRRSTTIYETTQDKQMRVVLQVVQDGVDIGIFGEWYELTRGWEELLPVLDERFNCR
jgi:hypothetical protein